jgi:DNA-binding CsgD family transcriptional regulator
MNRPQRDGDGRGEGSLVGFLEAAYRLETDDDTWLREVVDAACAVWARPTWAHAAIYDASNVNAFRIEHMCVAGGPAEAPTLLARGVELFSPALVGRGFRSLLVATCRRVAHPELDDIYDAFSRLGFPDALGINGLDPSGLGVFISLWMPEPREPAPAELNVYRRMAHHLGAAHRCRRRLAAGAAPADPTVGAEAILDGRGRVLHAEGPATATAARARLIETSLARDRVRAGRTRGDVAAMAHWPPLTSARWTLVDGFEHGGARYIVARENQAAVRGLAALSERERQVVAYTALGLSSKETGYAFGISVSTVRVLLARAVAKLGVRSRASLLEHPEVQTLRP